MILIQIRKVYFFLIEISICEKHKSALKKTKTIFHHTYLTNLDKLSVKQHELITLSLSDSKNYSKCKNCQKTTQITKINS